MNMLTSKKITALFKTLNRELKAKNVKGEIGICGGAVMCLVFKSRYMTKDVDAIFKPAAEIRRAAKKISIEFGITEDWLNDAVKGYFAGQVFQKDVLSLSNLRVWSPPPQYILAMKCISARFDSYDKDDVIFLIKYLGIKNPKEVFKIILEYYPQKIIPPKTQYLVEEIFDPGTNIDL